MRYFHNSAPLKASSKDSTLAKSGLPLHRTRHGMGLGSTWVLSMLLASCTPTGFTVNQLSLIVEPSDRPGTYTLSGKTDLPDGTELTVLGLRELAAPEQLLSAGQPSSTEQPSPYYTILDRDRVQVEGGQWNAILQLWQPDGKGGALENWQAKLPQSDRSFAAKPHVTFSVSTPPSGNEQLLDKQWQASKANPAIGEVGFTPDGDWYLQARVVQPLAPPQGAIPESVPVFNAAGRGLSEADLPVASVTEGSGSEIAPTTTAPLSPAEMMR